MTAGPAVVALLGAAIALAGCAPGTPRATFPPIGSSPQPPGDATAATVRAVTDALAAAGLRASEATRTYRPPEGALLAAAPRTVLQVTLPEDPTRGYVVVYALGSPGDATAAARDHAAYVSTGPGGVQFTQGTRFVIRVLGSTVVFFHWSPRTSTDERTEQIAEVLRTIGTEVPAPA